MNKTHGITLIEMIIFIVVLGILAKGLLNTYVIVLRSAGSVSRLMTASNVATKCINWYIGQRGIYGYASITPPGTVVPNFCTAPAGYSIATSVSNTTISPDTVSNYKTIVVQVRYGGALQASESILIANY
jgi:type II secretory pathway pseudopilin PulG